MAMTHVVFPHGIYTASYSPGIPFIPTQHVKLTTLQPREGKIELSGIFNAEGTMSYEIVDGEWKCSFSENIDHYLQRKRVSIRNMFYDSVQDCASIDVHILKFGRIHMIMRRVGA